MPLQLSEQFVSSIAPNEKAVLDGRALIRKGAFRTLARNDDGTLVFGECQGSGKEPYRVSMDLATATDRPTLRCSCPSRQIPCKHAIGLMLAYLGKQDQLQVAEPPADLLEKRAKLLERSQRAQAAGEPGAAAASAPPRKRQVNKAAQQKKTAAQLEALESLEQLTLDLVTTGLGGLTAKGIKGIAEQARRMADADLQGARERLLRLAAVAQAASRRASGADDDDEDDDDLVAGRLRGGRARAHAELQARMTHLLTQLWVVVRRGRKVLEGKQEEDTSKSQADAEVESLLGRRWQLPDLKEAGYFTTGRTLLELCHERTEDEVLGQVDVSGYLVDLEDGEVRVERTVLPFAALRAAQSSLRHSRSGTLQVAEAALYPGEELNRRIRWNDREPGVVQERPRTPEDYARLHEVARPLEVVLKRFRDQLKNPLLGEEAVVLVALRRVGQVAVASGAARLVLEDPAGQRLVLEDPPDRRCPTSTALRHAAAAFGPRGAAGEPRASLAVRLFADLRERTVKGQGLALFIGEKQLRLGL